MASGPRVIRTLFFVFLLLIPANLALAAKVERKELVLRGVALDRAGKPMPGARIVVTGDLETNTITDQNGNFVVTLPLGTVAEVRQRPVRFVLDARSRGKSLSVDGGPSKLELLVRGASGNGGTEGLEAVANIPQLGEVATRTLQTPKQSFVPFDVTFTAGRGRVESVRNLVAVAPANPPAPARTVLTQDPSARAADSLLDSREPPSAGARGAGSAAKTEPIEPVMKAVPNAGAGTTTAPVVSAPRTPPPPSATPVRTTSAPLTRSRSEVMADSSRSAVPARDARRSSREPPTALEMLESARRRGTILAGEAERDSLRTIDRERRSKARQAERGAEWMRAIGNGEEAQGADRRADKLLTASRKVPATERDERGSNEALLRGKMRTAKREKDSLEVLNWAREQQRQAAARDNIREADKIRARDRDARRYEASYRLALRRDSLGTLARAMDKFREQERQESLRSLRKGPRLDRRIPVARRTPRVEEPSGDRQSEGQEKSCFCNVEGTIEVHSTKPLASPFGVTVTVRGRPSLRDRVLLFMGAPREFVIGRVPCGTRYLDVLPEPGRQYFVERTRMLGPLDCESGTLRQIRVVLVPR